MNVTLHPRGAGQDRYMLLDKLLEFIDRQGVPSPGEKVVAAVSGGADSVALLHALWSVREQLDITIHVAHLNHGIRGKQADQDSEFVENFARSLGLPCTVEKADVPAVKKTLRLSLEEAARKVRYEFLERVADKVGAARIATAHTLDDQAETVLMNLIRGAGLEGLAGIPPVRGPYIRPLLAVSRQEVEQYCADNDLTYRTDLTNLLVEHRRNKIRLELVPLLESEYNPAIKSSLASMAEILRDEASFLSDSAAAFLGLVSERAEADEIVLDLARFINAPDALRRRCLRSAIEMVKGDLKDVEFRQVERILKRLQTGKDFTLTLPSGLVYAAREGMRLRVYRVEPEEEVPEIFVELPVPGTVDIPQLEMTLTSEELPMPVDFQRPPGSMDIVIDAASVQGRLMVRNWRKGDRIRPLGMSEEKKLQDIFVDNKIPRRSRGAVPIVADAEKIIWVVGITVSDSAKITEGTTCVLRLAAHPPPNPVQEETR